MAWDPYQSIAPCWLSRSSEQVPSAVGPNLLHPALLRARVKVAPTDSVAHVEEPPRMPTVDQPSSEVWLPIIQNHNQIQLSTAPVFHLHYMSGLLPRNVLLGSHQRISGRERRGWYGIWRTLVRGEECGR